MSENPPITHTGLSIEKKAPTSIPISQNGKKERASSTKKTRLLLAICKDQARICMQRTVAMKENERGERCWTVCDCH